MYIKSAIIFLIVIFQCFCAADYPLCACLAFLPSAALAFAVSKCLYLRAAGLMIMSIWFIFPVILTFIFLISLNSGTAASTYQIFFFLAIPLVPCASVFTGKWLTRLKTSRPDMFNILTSGGICLLIVIFQCFCAADYPLCAYLSFLPSVFFSVSAARFFIVNKTCVAVIFSWFVFPIFTIFMFLSFLGFNIDSFSINHIGFLLIIPSAPLVALISAKSLLKPAKA